MSEDISSGGGDWGGGGDSYSETSYESWFSRIGKSFTGILFGLVLIPVALYVLWWNEGRAVDRYEGLAEAGQNVATVAADKIDPAYEGKLVHLIGNVATEETLSDPVFGVVAKGMIRLAREVTMYGWEEKATEETRTKVGGGKETKKTYHYERAWLNKERYKDSGGFKIREGHENPPWPESLAPTSYTASKVTLGAFTLSANQVGQFHNSASFPLKEEDVQKLPEDFKKNLRVVNGDFYKGKGGESDPQVGDFKIHFTVTKPGQASVIAKQSQGNLVAYTPKSARATIEELRLGSMSAQEMIKAAEAENQTLTWILRLVGFILVVVGIYLIFNPLVVLADVIPILGNFTGCLLSVLAMFIGFVLSAITIAIAWIAHRPIVAIPLLILAGVGMVGIFILIRKAAKHGKTVPVERRPLPG